MTKDNNTTGQRRADRNLSAFLSWIASKTDEDFRQIVMRGQLSRKEIAKECCFAKSVLLQNPRVKDALSVLENQLRERGVLPLVVDRNASAQASVAASNPRVAQDKARLKRLEAENAALRVELMDLRDRLKRFRHMDDILSLTGRLPR